MTDNEKLIRDAGAAILRAHSDHPQPGEADFDNDAVAWAEALAGAALAVFEKAHTPTDDEREAQGWREAEEYADDHEPSKRAETADDFMAGWRTADRLRRTEPQGEPSAEVIGEWFTSSHGVAVAAVAPMTDRGPAVMIDGRVMSPNDVAALVEFKLQGEPSDAQVEHMRRALNRADIDYSAREQRADAGGGEMEPGDWFTFLARAALRAASAVTEQGEADSRG